MKLVKVNKTVINMDNVTKIEMDVTDNGEVCIVSFINGTELRFCDIEAQMFVYYIKNNVDIYHCF